MKMIFDLDMDKCVACGACAVRQKYGYEPACVRICPTRALLCVSEDDYAAKRPQNSLREANKR